MFGQALELRRAVYQMTVRIGLTCWLALVLLSSSMVAAMEVVLPGGRLGPRTAHDVLPIFGALAAFSAVVAVFVLPAAFRRLGRDVRETSPVHIHTIFEAVHSEDPYVQAAGRLGLLAMAQMIGAAAPALLGVGAFLVGARLPVFGVFVALSGVVLAAAVPRPSEWDDSVERAAAETLALALDSSQGA